MKKKPLIVLSALLCTGALLGGCNNNPKGGNEGEGSHEAQTTKYTVRFLVDGVAYGESIEVEKDAKVTAPTVPTKPDNNGTRYSFSGWMKGSTLWNFDDPVTSDLELVAQFDESYEVKFFNGTTQIGESQFVDEGETPVAPADPTKEDQDGYRYTFAGWADADNADPGDAVSVLPSVIKPVDWYAAYSSEEIEYTATIQFDYDGGAESKTVKYKVSDREDKLADVLGELPEDDDLYTYSFEEEITELPLENKTYKVKQISKSFDADLSGDSLPKELGFTQIGEEEKVTVADNEIKVETVFSSGVGNSSYIHTNYKYSAFKLEMAVKNDTGRLAITLGGQDVTSSTGYKDGKSDVDGRVALYFHMDGANKNIHFIDNSKSNGSSGKDVDFVQTKTSTNPAASCSLKANYDQICVEYNTGKLTVSVNGEVFFNKVPLTYELKPGYIVVSQCGGASNVTEINKFKVTALEYIKDVVGPKTFTSSFENDALPTSLEYVKNSSATGSGCTIESNVLTANFGDVVTPDLLVTKNKYTYFELTMSIKLDANGGADARINLGFGLASNTAGMANHSANNGKDGECIMLKNGNARVWKANETSYVDSSLNLSSITSDFLTLKLVVAAEGYSMSINGGDPVTLNAPYTATEGYIAFTVNTDRPLTKMMLQSIAITDTTQQ